MKSRSGFTTYTGRGIRNVHERTTPGSVKHAWSLLEQLGSPADQLWPGGRWPRMHLNHGVTPGSQGGHGALKYHVSQVEPHRRVRFDFDGFPWGYHEFSIAPTAGGVHWRHLLVAAIPLSDPVHDAVLEDLFDRAEALMAGRPIQPRRLSMLMQWASRMSGLALKERRGRL